MEPSASGWIDRDVRRGVRDRCADLAAPQALSLELARERELLAHWVRGEGARRTRAVLLKEAGSAGIERAEALCERLLREGWIERREHLTGGRWEWQWIAWRDLDGLQALLGVVGKQARGARREALLQQARAWVDGRAAGREQPAVDPDLLDEMRSALEQLAQEKTLRPEALQARLGLLHALADWHDAGASGLRRDFALKASGTTKGITDADWRWLDAGFDLERLRITRFAPLLWLAGAASLLHSGRRVDLDAVHLAGLPLADVRNLSAVEGAPRLYWLIENRASFERQAQQRSRGELLLWLPGRPSSGWLDAVAHLLRLAPAPARVSADADPAGVDIACTAGALWESAGQAWEPHRMGVAEWESTGQRWPLNEHDRALLQRLLARAELHPQLRALCGAMQREGRKAEQESWL
jgi:hypothetical protein